MGKTFAKLGSMLLMFVIVLMLVPTVLTANAVTVTEPLDLSDTHLFNIVGNNVVSEGTDSDGGICYVFSGGGINTYNKITTQKSYSGYVMLTFDIQFESSASDEMFFITPRGNYTSNSSIHFANSITSNFVLHTTASGQRLSVTDSSGMNISNRVSTDSTMSTTYDHVKTENWYSIKIVIAENAYYAKFWLAGEQEPENFNCVLDAAEGDLTDGVIGFAKRGSGNVLLRNVYITNAQTGAEEKAIFSDVEKLSTIHVALGTSLDDINLPNTIRIGMSDGTTRNVDVVWDTSSYQPDTLGTYTFAGVLQSENGANPNNLFASISVEIYSYAYTDTLVGDTANWTHNEMGIFSNNDGIILLGGGGVDTYNTIISTDSYIGNIRLQFDVQFSSIDSSEMLIFAPRFNTNVLNSAKYTGICGNFVLHTNDTKGLRLSNEGKTQITDTTISDRQFSATNIWYTIRFEIYEKTYRLKFWPAGESEESGSSWMEYTIGDDVIAGGIAFQKRGTGTLKIRNIAVAYNEKAAFSANNVESLPAVKAPYGTLWEDLKIPTTLTVSGSNNTVKKVNISWNKADYSSIRTGSTQIISGELDLPLTENPDNLLARIEITVLPQDAVFTTSTIWECEELKNVNVYHQFGTVVTKSGTILATCEARIGGDDCNNPSSIVLKRSTDGGISWGDTIVVTDCTENKCSSRENDCGKAIYGHFFANPTPVVDYSNGTIYLFYSENFSNTSSKLFYKVSIDDGLTWSAAVEITSIFSDDPHGRSFHLPGPGHGLQIENGQYEGRLIVEVWHRHATTLTTAERKYGLSILYSDDGGTTWNNSEYIEVGHNMNEGRVAQLTNGVLVINSRSTDNTRKQTISTDGGIHWTSPTTWNSIGSYGNCDSGFTSQVNSDGTQLLTTHILNNTTVRNTLYVFLSLDNGNTWEYSALLWSDSSIATGTGASDINRIRENTYGVIHGTKWDGNNVEYVVINTAYITGLAGNKLDITE